MQAVQNSDYAIAQFVHLGRLLLVHGRWSYMRVSLVICYSFYKNMAFVLAQYCWSFQAGSSGQKFYTEVGYQMYNVLFTSLPVIVYGIWEQDASAHTSLEHPALYRAGQQDQLFNKKSFSRWVLNAIWHALVLCMLPTYTLSCAVLHDGRPLAGVWQLGNVVFTCVVIVVNLRLALEVRYWIWVHWFVFSGMILAWIVFDFVISALTFPALSDGTADIGIASMLFIQPTVWLTVLLTSAVALLPDMLWVGWWFSAGLQDGLAQRLRQQEIHDGQRTAGCHCGCCCLCGDGCADRHPIEPVEEEAPWVPEMGSPVNELVTQHKRDDASPEERSPRPVSMQNSQYIVEPERTTHRTSTNLVLPI
eukprot:TRINITY_DN50000_c0_g1_i1.p1 TRINITY_DN50000_c0_g1~~TRINITY_DN50000_c0_g1_i1.p1  ORF type:complete len:362 (-),score=102.34 TRINITY_DN50000_c0_g1_i1:9-1094(-)